ncbi:dTDP-4-dehydrorhamnose reductase [compost metagenome]
MSSWSDETRRPLVHISTDQFYTGDGTMAHDEGHPVTIQNNYASTKFIGEQLALASGNSLVLRTAIVGIRGWERLTFAEWALDAVLNDRGVRLFQDAYTSAIDVESVALTIHGLLDGGHRGLFNVGTQEVYSKADFVLKISHALGKPLTNATLGSVKEMPARRGDSLGLDVTKVQEALSRQMPTLEDVVTNVIQQHKTRNNNAL